MNSIGGYELMNSIGEMSQRTVLGDMSYMRGYIWEHIFIHVGYIPVLPAVMSEEVNGYEYASWLIQPVNAG